MLGVTSDEAGLRGKLGEMFVELSSRSQALVERQIRLIDELEQGEQDSGRLASLFKMDHIATRMRRYSQNLLVLAGHELPGEWNRPVALVDVIRAAVSQIEDYERVSLDAQPGISVSGPAVKDVVHLLAELTDNATSLSAAGTPVDISASSLASGGVLVDVTDQGVGMHPEVMAEANRRLDSPPAMDFAVSRNMGLFVVGRLAARHGIKVRLQPAAVGGLTALVWLPDAVASRPDGAAGFDDATRPGPGRARGRQDRPARRGRSRRRARPRSQPGRPGSHGAGRCGPRPVLEDVRARRPAAARPGLRRGRPSGAPRLAGQPPEPASTPTPHPPRPRTQPGRTPGRTPACNPASTRTPQPPPEPSPPSLPSSFSQPSAPASSSPFGQPSAPASSSPFGQPSAPPRRSHPAVLPSQRLVASPRPAPAQSAPAQSAPVEPAHASQPRPSPPPTHDAAPPTPGSAVCPSTTRWSRTGSVTAASKLAGTCGRLRGTWRAEPRRPGPAAGPRPPTRAGTPPRRPSRPSRAGRRRPASRCGRRGPTWYPARSGPAGRRHPAARQAPDPQVGVGAQGPALRVPARYQPGTRRGRPRWRRPGPLTPARGPIALTCASVIAWYRIRHVHGIQLADRAPSAILPVHAGRAARFGYSILDGSSYYLLHEAVLACRVFLAIRWGSPLRQRHAASATRLSGPGSGTPTGRRPTGKYRGRRGPQPRAPPTASHPLFAATVSLPTSAGRPTSRCVHHPPTCPSGH